MPAASSPAPATVRAPPATEALHTDDPRAPKPAEMPRHERLADAEPPRQLGYWLLALGDEDLHDPQAVHVAQRAVVAPELAQRRLTEQGSPSDPATKKNHFGYWSSEALKRPL